MRDQQPVLYVASFLIASCFALPSAERFTPGAETEPPSLRRYNSLPDMSQITKPSQRKSKQWDFDSWATRLRAIREDTAGYRKSDSQLERHVGALSWAEPDRNNSAPPEQAQFKREVSSTSISNPFQRLIELPLWQTSLLSAKYVMNHENDVVTYRERTFPTAR